MPYTIRKSGHGWKVYGPEGAKSKAPMPKARAVRQMKAILKATGGK